MADQIEHRCEITKVDAQRRLVWGFAIVSKMEGAPYYDTQGDHISETEMLTATTDFMVDARNHKLMHDQMGKDVGMVVHSLPLTDELAEAFGIACSKRGWLVGVRVSDEEVFAKYASGELRGFSIGGRGKRRPV